MDLDASLHFKVHSAHWRTELHLQAIYGKKNTTKEYAINLPATPAVESNA